VSGAPWIISSVATAGASLYDLSKGRRGWGYAGMGIAAGLLLVGLTRPSATLQPPGYELPRQGKPV